MYCMNTQAHAPQTSCRRHRATFRSQFFLSSWESQGSNKGLSDYCTPLPRKYLLSLRDFPMYSACLDLSIPLYKEHHLTSLKDAFLRLMWLQSAVSAVVRWHLHFFKFFFAVIAIVSQRELSKFMLEIWHSIVLKRHLNASFVLEA